MPTLSDVVGVVTLVVTHVRSWPVVQVHNFNINHVINRLLHECSNKVDEAMQEAPESVRDTDLNLYTPHPAGVQPPPWGPKTGGLI